MHRRACLPLLLRASLRASLLAALLAPLGCRSSAPAPPEPSVAAGINERFLAADADVEAIAATFEGESREIALHREAITAALGLAPGMRVADVGAGTGLFLEPFARAVGREGRVYALDIGPRLVEHMRARAAAAGLEQVEARLCDERSIELPPGSIDLAFVCDTYHHFEYPRSTLTSIRSSLVPGGRLFVLDFERIPGVSREWVLGHVRADKQVFTAEIVGAGFELVREHEILGLVENYLLEFRRP